MHFVLQSLASLDSRCRIRCMETTERRQTREESRRALERLGWKPGKVTALSMLPTDNLPAVRITPEEAERQQRKEQCNAEYERMTSEIQRKHVESLPPMKFEGEASPGILAHDLVHRENAAPGAGNFYLPHPKRDLDTNSTIQPDWTQTLQELSQTNTEGREA